MRVEIRYCEMCFGNRPNADRVAKELKEKMGLDSELTDVGKGCFDVIVEGRTVFSMAKTNRYPRHNEIVHLLQAGK